MFNMSIREFNQSIGKARRFADRGPVFVTYRGVPRYVFMNLEDYEQLGGPPPRKSVTLEELEALGQLRPAAEPISGLARAAVELDVLTDDLLRDVRGEDRGY